MWPVALAVVVVVLIALLVWRQHQQRCRNEAERVRHEIGVIWPDPAAPADLATLQRLTQDGHGSAEAWYCLGLAWLTRRTPEHAARAFQIASHRQCDYTTAAVLAFACMTVSGDQIERLPAAIRRTYDDMRRPPLLARPAERALFAALGADVGRPCNDAIDALGRLSMLRRAGVLDM